MRMTYPPIPESIKANISSLIPEELRDWAAEHYRTRTFFREEKIPTRSGLLYFVDQGFVRLESAILSPPTQSDTKLVNTIIDFVGANQAIDIPANGDLELEVIAQTERSTIFWVYWDDLEQWPDLRFRVLRHFQVQHQKQLMIRSILGQRRTVEQLWLYLSFLAKSYGTDEGIGLKIPFGLTHGHLSSVLGTTRVTVSRLLTQLKDDNRIIYFEDQNLGIPTHS